MSLHQSIVYATDLISLLLIAMLFLGSWSERTIATRQKTCFYLVLSSTFILSACHAASLYYTRIHVDGMANAAYLIYNLCCLATVGLCFVFIYLVTYKTNPVASRIFILIIAYFIFAFIVMLFSMLTDTFGVYQDGIFIPGVLYSFINALLCIILFIPFVAIAVYARYTDFNSTLTFASYFIFPALSRIVAVWEPDYDFNCIAITLSLSLFYIVSQARLLFSIENEKLDYFQSFSNIYSTMHHFDLEHNTWKELSAHMVIHEYTEENKDLQLQELIWATMKQRVVPSQFQAIKEFTDFSTLEERMADLNTIYVDLINVDNKWFRFSFLRVGNIDEPLRQVIFTTQDIDSAKRKERQLYQLSTSDELTHLYNRNAYESHIREISSDSIPEDLWYIIVDLNGLKEANDTFGHAVGDELIVNMAQCMNTAFSPYGKVYRTGGDEFVAVLQANTDDVEGTLLDLESMASVKSGEYGTSISYSIGYANTKESPNRTISEIEKLADSRMYANKKEYYRTRGSERDRRHKTE